MRNLTQTAPMVRPMPHIRRAGLLTLLRYFILLVVGATLIVPFLWMIATSLKPPGAVLTVPPEIIPHAPTLANYRQVADAVPLVRMFANSVIVTVVSVVGQLTTSALSAYAFARMRWRGRDTLFLL